MVSAVRTDGGFHLRADAVRGMLVQYNAFGRQTDDVVLDYMDGVDAHHRVTLSMKVLPSQPQRQITSSLTLHIDGYETAMAPDARDNLLRELVKSPSCPVQDLFWHVESRENASAMGFEIVLYCAFGLWGDKYMARGSLIVDADLIQKHDVRSNQDVADIIYGEITRVCLNQLDRNFGGYLGALLRIASVEEVRMMLSASSLYSSKRSENRRRIEQLTHGTRPHMLDIIVMPPQPTRKSRRRLVL